ncbi:hypothetical protein ETB97_007211 [Aspergillus alliaceus]|uniref:Alpha/beta hydrolase fold-1 n=1 Tax=Petromyces alliaceus TaxID=209559 RepID=A0A5N7CLL5_PETAA|nr:Alpha/beta hydrolase fold-1 [Aspergillus alliaceus]KAF5856560.1 hypothetical protein ETB97_007211 [Aspergillus burnettii]
MTPTILFVPGIWEGPSVFDRISSLLTADGFNVETAALPSTGTISPGNPSMKDDIAAVHQHLKKIVERDQEVLLVLHSAGGFIGSEAMEGLDKNAREKQGRKGGVIGIVFIAGAVVPEGYVHQPLPFAVYESGACYCSQPEVTLFGDLEKEERAKWAAVLRPQPADGWRGTTTYAGWRVVLSVYLLCEEDKSLSISLQEQFADLAGSKLVRCSAGHVPQLSQPHRVVEVIKDAVSA